MCQTYSRELDAAVDRLQPEMQREFPNLESVANEHHWDRTELDIRIKGATLQLDGKYGVSFYYSKRVWPDPRKKVKDDTGHAEVFAQILVPALESGYRNIEEGCAEYCAALLRNLERESYRGSKDNI